MMVVVCLEFCEPVRTHTKMPTTHISKLDSVICELIGYLFVYFLGEKAIRFFAHLLAGWIFVPILWPGFGGGLITCL